MTAIDSSQTAKKLPACIKNGRLLLPPPQPQHTATAPTRKGLSTPTAAKCEVIYGFQVFST